MNVPDYGAGRETLCKGNIFAQLSSYQAEIREAKAAGIFRTVL